MKQQRETLSDNKLPEAISELVLEPYFALIYTKIINDTKEVYSSDNYERGNEDAFFILYTANNRQDFDPIILEIMGSEVEETEITNFKRINEESLGKFATDHDLLIDCKRISSLATEELAALIGDYLQKKCNLFLQELFGEKIFTKIEENFDEFKRRILASSESLSKTSKSPNSPKSLETKTPQSTPESQSPQYTSGQYALSDEEEKSEINENSSSRKRGFAQNLSENNESYLDETSQSQPSSSAKKPRLENSDLTISQSNSVSQNFR